MSRGYAYLPLGREIAISCRDTEQESIVRLEGGGVLEDGVAALWGSSHLGEHLVAQGLGKSKK
jgi:hypothetical protein